jgi:hypothetical protein
MDSPAFNLVIRIGLALMILAHSCIALASSAKEAAPIFE